MTFNGAPGNIQGKLDRYEVITKWQPFFADNNLISIYMVENFPILVQISKTFVPEGEIDNKWALVHPVSGLTLNRWQAITWANADPVHWSVNMF